MQELILPPPLNKQSQRNILLGIGFGAIMTSFDSSAVGAVLPIIAHAFHRDASSAQWLIVFYFLMICAFLLLAGRIGDLIGYTKVYLLGLKIFFVGALLSSIAPSLGTLIGFRIVEGGGAVLILANSAAIVTRFNAPNQRGRVLGLLSTMAYVGLTIGPVMAGWLTNVIGWRSIFIVTFILAGLAHFIGSRVLPRDAPQNTIVRLDIPFTILVAISLSFIVISFNQGKTLKWHSFSSLCFATSSVIITALIVRYGLKSDLKLLYNRMLTGAVVISILTYAALTSVVFILPFYLLEVQRLSPLEAGLVLSVRPVLTAMLAPISGVFSDKYRSYYISTLGLIILLAALISLTVLNNQSPTVDIILSLAGIGAGMGIFIAPNHNIIMSASLISHKGIASAIIPLTRNLGMLFGATLAGAIFSIKIDHLASAKDSLIFVTHTIFYFASFIGAITLLIMLVKSGSNFQNLWKKLKAFKG